MNMDAKFNRPINQSVEITSGEFEEVICKMLAPIARNGVLPAEDCNKYGIDVLRHKKEPNRMMFHFVTLDMLEINLETDMFRLRDEGLDYIDSLQEILITQMEKAREIRQEDSKIEVRPLKNGEPKTKPLNQAVSDAIH